MYKPSKSTMEMAFLPLIPLPTLFHRHHQTTSSSLHSHHNQIRAPSWCQSRIAIAFPKLSPSRRLSPQRHTRVINVSCKSSNRTPVPLRVKCIPERPMHALRQHALRQHIDYIAYCMIPFLIAGVAVPSSLAEEATVAVDASQIGTGNDDNSLLSRILAWTAFGLLFYGSIAVLILTIDSIVVKVNNSRERKWVELREAGEPYPKTILCQDTEKRSPRRKKSSTSSDANLNREQRRVERKLRDKEDKEDRKKQLTDKARNKSKKKKN